MRNPDNLIFAIIAGLMLLCVFMEYRLVEKRISLIPIPELPPAVEDDDEIEIMIKRANPFVSIDLPLRRNPFRLPNYLIDVKKQEPDKEDRLDLKLTAICWSHENPLAIIDGRIFGERDRDPLGRFTVKRIYPDRVLIELSGKGERVIKLKR